LEDDRGRSQSFSLLWYDIAGIAYELNFDQYSVFIV
jgi:hypothetical protein